MMISNSILVRALGIAAFVLASLAVIGAQDVTPVSATFDTGADGWKAGALADGATLGELGEPATPQWDASNGHPGGALFLTGADAAARLYFDAPASFLGNRRAYYGGELRYDIRSDGQGTATDAPDVVLVAFGITLVHVHPAPLKPGWNTRVVPLQQNAWRIARPGGETPRKAELERVLTYLKAIRLYGEVRGGKGTGWIDNVILRPPQMVTPDGERPPVMTDHGMPTPDRR